MHETDRVEQLFRGYSGRIFMLIAMAVLVTNLGRQVLPPLLPTILDDLVISTAAAGIAFTAMRVAYALMQYPSGRIADVVSRQLAIMLGLLILLLGFGLLTVTGAYPLFALSMILIGIGAAFFFVSERVLLSDLFVEKRGRAFGVNSAFSMLGGILAAGLAVIVLTVGPWQLAFFPVLLLLLALGFGFHVVSQEPYRFDRLRAAHPQQGELRATIGRVFGTSEIRWLVIAYTLIIFVWEGVLAFLPTYLYVTKGFTPAIAGGGFAALFAVGIVVQPVSGTISDWWDRRVVAGLATVLSILGLSLLLVSTRLTLVVVGIILYAAGLMAFTPVMQAYLLDRFPEASKGGDLGAFKTIYEGLSGFGPAYVGITAGLIGFSWSFGGFVLCLLVSGTIIFGLHFRSNDSNHVEID